MSPPGWFADLSTFSIATFGLLKTILPPSPKRLRQFSDMVNFLLPDTDPVQVKQSQEFNCQLLYRRLKKWPDSYLGRCPTQSQSASASTSLNDTREYFSLDPPGPPDSVYNILLSITRRRWRTGGTCAGSPPPSGRGTPRRDGWRPCPSAGTSSGYSPENITNK